MSDGGDAFHAAALLAVDPAGLKGAVLRAGPSPARDAWLSALRAALAPDSPWRRAHGRIDEEQFFGGLDLAPTLAAGRPVMRPGLVDTCTEGALILATAERCPAGLAAQLGARLEVGGFLLIALDEGMDADERAPDSLSERVAFRFDVDAARGAPATPSPLEIARARARLARMPKARDDEIDMVCRACLAFDIGSARAPVFALRAARAAAALAGRERPSPEDWAFAARVVLSPRARAAPPEAQDVPPPPSSAEENPAESSTPDAGDRLIEAVKSALPRGFLDRLASPSSARGEARSEGAGAEAKSARRGRPAGVRQGALRAGERLDLVATLRAAAPWQELRRRKQRSRDGVLVRGSDFRIRRHVRRRESTIVLAVDASGSTALQRLAEAKGAASTLLADAYVTRARVAVIAFRDRTAQILLPPTRSLARARRAFADLPGGGATPLAAAIDAANALAQSERAKGRTPMIVFLSDGRGNIDRAGAAGRPSAERDALAAARALRASGLAAVFIDTAPRSRPEASALAAAMGARYALLPLADGDAVAEAVRGHGPRRR
jgi:magnesium chelatase subunit D